MSGASAAAVGAVRRFVDFISTSQEADLNETNAISKLPGGDIWVWKSLDAWVFFSTDKNRSGETYVLVVDLVDLSRTEAVGGEGSGAKNPKTDRKYNPKINSRINPRVNSNLNPRVNSRINPRVNSRINPRVNSSINPRVNSSINLRVNSSINPRVNSSINPRINAAINPRINKSYSGPFLYDTNLNKLGHIVRVNDAVSLVFDRDNSLLQIAISRDGGFTVFNESNEYIEHWVEDGQGGYIRFDTENQWVGIVV